LLILAGGHDMTIDVEVVSSIGAYSNLRADWNGLVVENQGSLLGQDGTSTYEWFETILSAFREAAESRVVVARKGSAVVGILPVVADLKGRLGPRILMATELYGGRNGPLLLRHEAEVFVALLSGLDQAWPGWGSLQMTLLANSENASVVIGAANANRYTASSVPNQESPFFPLFASADDFKRGISKSVLQMLRTSRNKFSKIGSLSFHEYVREHEADELLEVVLAIERRSWKHEAGTAITAQPRQEAFYRALFPRAMKAGLLHAEVLFLQDEPIAYNFGLIHQGVFSCLKHSNAQLYDKLSPSYLVNEWLFGKLRSKGVVTFDFMGLAEPHKLRWSEENCTYKRETWMLFNRTLQGRVAAFADRNKRRLAMFSAGSITSEQDT
jgi:CelD/BcsL family acetyltransferase involved in cellulose biosynthesis